MAGYGPVTSDKDKRSYFDALNPWSTSRSSTPSIKDDNISNNANSKNNTDNNKINNANNNSHSHSHNHNHNHKLPVNSTTGNDNPPPQNPTPANHTTTHLYGQSFAKYPVDCPPLTVLWYHAVDVPKRKPSLLRTNTTTALQDKPQAQPKKYVGFSASDSQALENAYQKLLGQWEGQRGGRPGGSTAKVAGKKRAFNMVASPKMKAGEPESPKSPGTCVPVNEDYLFEVSIEERELSPIYWLGPTYDVRRGTWFYQEGNTLRPCEENLASQLEEGYLKTKPWTYPDSLPKGSRSRSASGRGITPKSSVESLKGSSTEAQAKFLRPVFHQPQTYRLFGTYMNHVATYQDSSTAWLSSDGMFSWVTSYLGGTKLVRGFTDPAKAKATTPTANAPTTAPTTAPTSVQADEKQHERLLKRRSAPPPTSRPIVPDEDDPKVKREDGMVENRFTRQISGFMGRSDIKQEEEAVRKREEEEIENDYNAQAGETQNREIEHLILITHGIGQLLSLRMESINFIHDINSFRKSLKSVYSNSADLRALNAELGDGPGNCRVQVLPICWRHLLDFPKRREKKMEQDVSEGFGDEDEYPALEDITIEGMAFARSLISDLALDVLLYQSAYRAQISEIVLKESNRTYNLFMERNPGFKGKVHIMGHSLGSAIMFDILCRAKEQPKPSTHLRNPMRFWPSSPEVPDTPPRKTGELAFDFEVEDLYCVGSPIGLFQMLKGRTIAARHMPNTLPSESPLNLEIDDPFLSSTGGAATDQRLSPITGLPFSVSSPKVAQLFNIFHPSDPISYRLEPLISRMMRDLKPQAMPYTKKSIFDSMAPNGLTGIGAKVGQSVNSLWSSVSSGITTSFLNRSLGLTSEDVARMNEAAATNRQAQNLGEGNAATLSDPLEPNAAAVDTDKDKIERANARKRELASSAMQLNRRTSTSGNELTLLDDELETLYSKFQKRRGVAGYSPGVEGNSAVGMINNDADAVKRTAEQRREWKLMKEELKVRALNRNGRVDFSIQEGTLDYNPLNALASHMSYWADEDVSHFVMSQLLSNRPRKNT